MGEAGVHADGGEEIRVAGGQDRRRRTAGRAPAGARLDAGCARRALREPLLHCDGGARAAWQESW